MKIIDATRDLVDFLLENPLIIEGDGFEDFQKMHITSGDFDIETRGFWPFKRSYAEPHVLASFDIWDGNQIHILDADWDFVFRHVEDAIKKYERTHGTEALVVKVAELEELDL